MRILVTGASGRLGSYLVGSLTQGPHEVIGWSGGLPEDRGGLRLRPVDLTDSRALSAAISQADPDVLIHAASVSSAEAARLEPDRAWAVNVAATEQLAEWVRRHHRRLLYTSTDLVFDGSRSWYREGDPARPILEYGRTKHAAEHAVLAWKNGLVVRLSLLYGLSRPRPDGFFDRALTALKAGTPQAFFSDEYRTPLDYETASRILVRLAESESTGLVHVGGRERLSRWELMRRAVAAMGIDPQLVRANRRSDVPLAEPRPADLSLDTSRLQHILPDIEIPGVEAALARASGQSGSR
jgi:dTDP-4-dehydrorhamnose reductase